MLGPIADNGLEDDFHAELIETLGQEQGIGVLAIRRQELRADSYDLSVHAYQCKPNVEGLSHERQLQNWLGVQSGFVAG
jgi:hypothetical protein